jgi:hypothetical protein
LKLSPNGEHITLSDLANEVDMILNADRHRLNETLGDMRKTGEVERITPGVVAYRGRPRDAVPDVRSAMWSVLRMRKSVTLDDLQELAGAGKRYAREFLAMLAKRGCIERIPKENGRFLYRLIQDPGPQTPTDSEKADRLRALREAKKRAIEQLDLAGESLIAATHAVVQARMAINDISEEDRDGNE